MYHICPAARKICHPSAGCPHTIKILDLPLLLTILGARCHSTPLPSDRQQWGGLIWEITVAYPGQSQASHEFVIMINKTQLPVLTSIQVQSSFASHFLALTHWHMPLHMCIYVWCAPPLAVTISGWCLMGTTSLSLWCLGPQLMSYHSKFSLLYK